MSQITNTGQFSTFSIIRTIIQTNSVLAGKLSTGDFYEFEPKHKSPSFRGFPYIIINVPDVDIAEDMLGDYLRHKSFMVKIVFRMDYLAKDNYSTYISNLMTVLDSANQSFEAYGYSLIKVESDGPPEALSMNQKEMIEGRFTLTLHGEVVV